ncbi:MAG TPA: hypothetical protein VF798_02735 [Burkholderiaceae bacterium]
MSLNAIIGRAAAAPESAKAVTTPRMPAPEPGAATAASSLLAPTSHANRVGVAAYLSVLNPPPSASMHAEA